jgi:tRNA/tmRNA/rRNA uracil-C5-methylase (TrmA/RlmC/RlmD family)
MDFSIFPSGFGLREAGNFRKIVDIESCLIQSEWADKEWAILRSYLKDNLDIAQDRKSDQGILKYITLRTATGTSETMSIFTFDLGSKDCDQELTLEKWLLENSSATHIVFCYNPRQSEVSASGSFRIIRGNNFYTEKVRGKEFQVPFDSFFQPNPRQFEPILESIETWLQESNSTILLDLFCGSGFFSLLFGEGMDKIAGWDVFSPSIEIAQNLVKNKFPNTEVQFEAVDLFQRKHLPRFLELFQKINIKPEDSFLILDPPRNGAGEMVTEWILESGIQKIAYVSCNPSKQWDEIMNKIGKKYSPKQVLITDPYPHTPHMESVVLLERKKDILF